MSMTTQAHAQDDRVLAVCGPYKILYRGQYTTWFAGIEVTESIFLIETKLGSISTVLNTHSEGGSLTGELETYDPQTGKPQTPKVFYYSDAWMKKTLTVSVNDKVVEKYDCK
jgi:hypothetical protein